MPQYQSQLHSSRPSIQPMQPRVLKSGTKKSCEATKLNSSVNVGSKLLTQRRKQSTAGSFLLTSENGLKRPSRIIKEQGFATQTKKPVASASKPMNSSAGKHNFHTITPAQPRPAASKTPNSTLSRVQTARKMPTHRGVPGRDTA